MYVHKIVTFFGYLISTILPLYTTDITLVSSNTIRKMGNPTFSLIPFEIISSYEFDKIFYTSSNGTTV